MADSRGCAAAARSTPPRASRTSRPNASAWDPGTWPSSCACGSHTSRPRLDRRRSIAKLPAAPEMQRSWWAGYVREWRFYHDLAGHVPLTTPRYLGGAVSEADQLAATLLEDLGDDASAVRQEDGASLDLAEAVVDALATLHAAFWRRDPPSWLATDAEAAAESLASFTRVGARDLRALRRRGSASPRRTARTGAAAPRAGGRCLAPAAVRAADAGPRRRAARQPALPLGRQARLRRDRLAGRRLERRRLRPRVLPRPEPRARVASRARTRSTHALPGRTRYRGRRGLWR